MSDRATTAFSGRTAWARNLETPLRTFLRTETGSAVVPARGDARGARLGECRRRLLRPGLEHDRLDPGRPPRHRRAAPLLGELRPDDVLLLRRRARGAARVRHGRAARAAPGGAAARGRARRDARPGLDLRGGRTPATPRRTAGASRCRRTPPSRSAMLALVGPRFPDRLRAFMLTVVVVDDLVALVVIATVYSEHVAPGALLAAIGLLLVAVAAVRVRRALRARLPRARGGRLGGDDQVGRRPGRRRARRSAC